MTTLPDCDCDDIETCWICKERHHLSFFKKCDECGHNRMYWEEIDDIGVEPCWKCVMCCICGDGPASTGEVCESEECKKERAEMLKCVRCSQGYWIECFKEEERELGHEKFGACPNCVRKNTFHCDACEQDKQRCYCDIIEVNGKMWCDVCFHAHRKYLAETEGLE